MITIPQLVLPEKTNIRMNKPWLLRELPISTSPQERQLSHGHTCKKREYYYSRWGAFAKVRHLEDTYPDLFVDNRLALMGKSAPLDSLVAGSEGSIDLAAVLASKVLLREIVLNELLRKLMKLLIETAGAERGCLISNKGGFYTYRGQGQYR